MIAKANAKDKTSVFISYAREDAEFVLALIKGLEEQGVESVGDWLLMPGQEYERRLREMSLKSHALIFVISPDSIKSEACRNELAFAVESKKQILPVSRRDHGEDNLLDSALRAPQWIFLREGNDFEGGVRELRKAINTDFELMEMHGRILLAADSWKNNHRNRSYLLRKDGLREAESWLAKTSVQPDKLPQPTPLEVEFILVGQRARSRGTRIAIGAVLAVALSLSVLSVVALAQRSRAVRYAEDANRQAEIAQQNEAKAIKNAEEAQQQRTLAEHNAKEAKLQKKNAEDNLVEARRQQSIAQLNEQKALRQKAIADDRFTRLSVANGARLLEASDVPGSLLWFANPLSIQPPDETVHRERVAATLNLYPRLVQLLPHDAAITTLQMNTAGDKLLTLSEDSSVRAWDSRTGTLVWSHVNGSQEVMAVALAPDGTTCAILLRKSHDDKSIREFLDKTAREAGEPVEELDLPEFRELAKILNPLSEVRLLDAATGAVRETVVLGVGERPSIWALSGDTFILSGSVYIPEGPSFKKTVIWRRGQSPAVQHISDAEFLELSLSQDGRTFLAGEYSGVWHLFNRDGTVIAEGKHAADISGSLSSLALSPTGSRFATADSNGKVMVWNAGTGSPTGKPLQHGSDVQAMAFSPDSRWLATASGSLEDGAVRVWDIVTGQEVFRHELPEPGSGVAFSASGRYLLSLSRSNTLEGAAQIWDVGTGLAVSPPIASVFTAAWRADGRTIITAGTDDTVKMWDVFRDDTVLSLDQQELLRNGRFSPDGLVVAAEADGRLERHAIARFDREDFSREAQPRSQWNRATFALDASGSIRIYVRDNDLIAFDREGNTLPAFNHEEDMPHVSAVEISGDSRTVLIAGGHGSGNVDTGRILVWDALTGQARTPSLKHDGFVEAASFSPDGRLIVSASRDGIARIWSVNSGATLHSLEHGSAVSDAVFDRTGARVATAAADFGVRIWDTATGKLVGSVMRLEGRALVVRFSPDGASLLTIGHAPDGKTGVMRLWDVASQRAKAAPVSLGDFSYQKATAAFSPDGQFIIAAVGGKGFRVWTASTLEAVTPRLDSGWESARQLTETFLARQRSLLMASDRNGAPLLIGIGTRSGSAHRVMPWALPSDLRPWVTMATELELIASRRIDVTGALVRLTPEEIKTRWEQLKATQPRLDSNGRDGLFAWHRREAEECELLREWSCMVWHLNQIQGLAPSAVDGRLHVKKGRALAEMERWSDADAEYSLARALGVSSVETVPYIARLRAAGGDPREHQELIASLIELTRASSDGKQRAGFLRAALVAPWPLSDSDRASIIELAEADLRSAKHGFERADARGVLALLEYRSGRLADTLAHLEALRKENYLEKGNFLPALVAWRLGDRNAAAKYFDEAQREMEDFAGVRRYKDGNHASSLYWYEWVERSILQSEASKLIKEDKSRDVQQ